MSERNKLTVSPVSNNNDLFCNGFTISVTASEDFVTVGVYRKGVLVYAPTSLQEAVKWCED